MDGLREQIAVLQHEIWVHWMGYLFGVSERNEDGSITIPADKVERWTRQINSSYQELSESEKASDLEQADKILALFRNREF